MLKVSDWVTTKTGGRGIVKRISKDKSWADINWGTHSKRMKLEHLIIQSTISIGDGLTVTDMNRENELKEASQ